MNLDVNHELKLPKYPPVLFVRFFNAIRMGLIRISRKLTHPNVVVLEYVQNLWLLGALNVTVKLGIADILKNGRPSISELASLTGTREDPLYRMMRFLASVGIFREKRGSVFCNTRISEALCEGQMRSFISHSLNPLQFRMAVEMMHSLKTGKSTLGLFVSGNPFDHIGGSKELNELYNQAMVEVSRMQAPAILSAFPFNKFPHIVDIGGGTGLLLSMILEKYNNVQGTLFDLPHVVNNIPGDINPTGDRLRIVAGSFLDSVPENGNLYIMKNILHCLNNENAVILLKNIRKVIPLDGRMLLIEIVIDNGISSSWGKVTDIYMMVGIEGRERTKNEYIALLSESGFSIEKIIRTVAPHSIIVVKPG
jgi:hypothetical protein